MEHRASVPVDENLFTGEDLDELEEELNTLDLAEWHQTSQWKIESTFSKSWNWLY